MQMLFRKREPTEKKQFLLPGQGEEEVYSHTNPPKVFIGGFEDGEVCFDDDFRGEIGRSY